MLVKRVWDPWDGEVLQMKCIHGNILEYHTKTVELGVL